MLNVTNFKRINFRNAGKPLENTKLVTVITSVYNKAPYVKDWAECLSKQTYLDKAIILVIDDGSTDNSLNLVKKYSEQYNLPIKLILNEKNIGLLQTVKKAYHLLNTKYFAVLDADDYWVSPKKLENAVKFLELHDDYSAYATNYYNSSSSQKIIPTIPVNVPSMTFENMEGTPFFQTSATVFRNYFTKELLDKFDYFVDEKGFVSFTGDAFRNSIAWGFGKFYFENSLDAVWRSDIGIWGTLGKLEQDLMNMQGYWELFEFYKSQFQMDDNALHMLNLTIHFYFTSLNEIINHMKDMSFFKLEFKKRFIKILEKYPGSTDTEKAWHFLYYYGKCLNDIGFTLRKA